MLRALIIFTILFSFGGVSFAENQKIESQVKVSVQRSIPDDKEQDTQREVAELASQLNESVKQVQAQTPNTEISTDTNQINEDRKRKKDLIIGLIGILLGKKRSGLGGSSSGGAK